MKKLIVLCIGLILMLSISACGQNFSQNAGQNSEQNSGGTESNDDGKTIRKESYEINGVHYYEESVYDAQGELTEKRVYNAEGYLTQEKFYVSRSIVSNFYSYEGKEKWLWTKREMVNAPDDGRSLLTITCYLSTGEYIVIPYAETRIDINNPDSKEEKWNSTTNPALSVTFVYDDFGNIISRKISSDIAYDSQGKEIACSEELLNSFDVAPQFPTE